MRKVMMVKMLVIGFITNLGCESTSQPADRSSDWIEDINYYHKTLEEKHIDLYHTLSREDFTAEIEVIKKEVPELSDFEIIAQLMKLTHKIGGGKNDGHTAIPLWDQEFRELPIELMKFGNEFRIIGTAPGYQHLLRKKIVAINSKPIEEVYTLVSQYAQFVENEQSSMVRTCRYMLISDLLHSIKVIDDVKRVNLEVLGDGEALKKIVIEALPKKQIAHSEYISIPLSNEDYLRPKSFKNKNLWFKLLNDKKTVYIKFKRYPDYNEMQPFARKALDFIDETGAENMIIDLRGNYGGNTFLGLQLAERLVLAKSIDWLSGVYILIDRQTYSAAVVNSLNFRQILNGKIIGEPSGGNPNGYQDLGQFNLPNTGLLITYSQRLFRLQEKRSFGIKPDKIVEYNWRDYSKGNDTMMDWVIKQLAE